ncbi:MAG: hypothetical protein ABI771_17775 [Betaproteobacteria bacterium]
MKSLLGTFFLLFFLIPVLAQAQQDPKSEALQRVVQAHDPAMFVATGALYLKQEAIRANKGKALSPDLDAEVESIIDARVRDPAWFRETLSAVMAPMLSTEEADEIATHFATEGGQVQRRTVELAVGEILTNTYSFTDKIDYRLAPYSKREMDDLHRAAGPMRGTCNCPTPKELEEMRRVANGRPLDGVQDLSANPDAVKFASSGVGVKYMKIMSLQGIAAMNAYFDSVAKQIREVVATRRAAS